MLSALRSTFDPTRGIQMTVALERTYDSRELILQQLYPRDVWLELMPDGATRQRRPGVRFISQTGFPAAVWSADAISWPFLPGSSLPTAPVIEAWWAPDRPAEPDASLEFGRDFESFDDLRGKLIKVNGVDVKIESVGIEDRHVMIESNRKAIKSCLVARIAHSRETPVRLRVDAAATEGTEESLYEEAGKTMLVCWPFTRDRPISTIRHIHFVLLNHFKQDAEARGFHIRLDRLGQPDAGTSSPSITSADPRAGLSTNRRIPATSPAH
jgi:hypothetical protein